MTKTITDQAAKSALGLPDDLDVTRQFLRDCFRLRIACFGEQLIEQMEDRLPPEVSLEIALHVQSAICEDLYSITDGESLREAYEQSLTALASKVASTIASK